MDPVLTTGIPWLDKVLVALAAIGALCSLLSHFIPPSNIVGKAVSWAALNFGKQLTKPSTGSVIDLPPPKGFARIGTVIVLAVVALFAAAAYAEPNPEAVKQAVESDPSAVQPGADVAPTSSQFGGCVGAKKNVCFAPELALSLVAFNFKTGKLEGAFSPGIGYGFTVNPGKWSSFGLAAYGTLDPGAQSASASILASLFNGYFRPGMSKAFINDHSWRFLFSTGVSLP